MTDTTFNSANNLFDQKKYSEAFDQFCSLANKKDNPAFCSFMAGKCLSLSGKNPDAFSYYQKAVEYDDSNAFINREIERFIIDQKLIKPNKHIIWHYFPNTTNIGDSGAAAGIRSLFHSLTDDFFFFTLSCRKDTFDVLKRYQLKASGMIIGGGGLFFKQPLASGWYFPLSFSEINILEIPIIPYAIGFNKEYSDSQIWNLEQNFINNIANFHQRFSLKSVRDYWSKNILEKTGVHDLYVVPCPSAFLKPLPWHNMSIDTSKEIVGLSITDRSLQKDQKVKFFSVFFKFAKWLVQNGFSPLFIMQDTADDIALAKIITENNFNCILPNTAREAVSIYNQCTYVIGMRGHSLILASGQQVPILGISYNKKVDAFMEMIDLQNYCLNQNEITECSILIKNFKRLIANKDDVIAVLQNKREVFYRSNIEYCKKAISLISKT